jgi:hypothetical protein
MQPDRFLIAGLNALCRSHIGSVKPPKYHLPDGFIEAHRGAGMLASYYLLEQQLVDPRCRQPIQAMLESEWLARPIFAPYPEEPAAPGELQVLLDLYDRSFGFESGDPHHVIFPAFALRTFRRFPHLLTSSRITGLCHMASFDMPEEPGATMLPAASVQEPFSSSRFADVVLNSFITSISGFPSYDTSYSGHVLTWGLAVHDLYDLGYEDLAKKAERSYRHYLRRFLDATQDPFGGEQHRPEPPPETVRPDQAAFWSGRPVGNLEKTWAHLPKYAFGLLSMCALSHDQELKERARQLYYLLVY